MACTALSNLPFPEEEASSLGLHTTAQTLDYSLDSELSSHTYQQRGIGQVTERHWPQFPHL